MTFDMKVPGRDGGFTLIEALIAAVIFAVGLIALARFQGGLVQSGGHNKARSEAVHIAQQKLEEFRGAMMEGDYTALIDTGGAFSNDPGGDITGVNATFTRSWKIDDGATPDRKAVTMQVNWTGPQESDQESVTLDSHLVWKDPAGSATIANGDDAKKIIAPPSEGSRWGDKTYETTPEGEEGETVTTNSDDGTTIYEKDNGEIEIIDADGKVQIVILDGFDLVNIEGRVYIEDGAKPRENLSVEASDSAYCAEWADSSFYRDGTTYQYYNYRCYLANKWYGNIGVLDTTNTGSSDQSANVCMGDPYSVNVTNERSRQYRGYEIRLDDNGDPMVDVNGDPIWYLNGITSANIAALGKSHDFLIVGGSTDDACRDAMLRGDPKQGALALKTSSVPSSTEYFFYGNAPEDTCLTPDTYCIDDVDADIGGRFNFYGAADFGDVTGVSGTNLIECIDNAAAYRCRTADLTGSPWSGDLTFSTGAVFCDAPETYTLSYYNVTGRQIHHYDVADSEANCPVGTRIAISGTVGIASGETHDLSGSIITAEDDNGTVTTCNTTHTNTGSTYECNVTYTADGWTGSITLDPAIGWDCSDTSLALEQPVTADALNNDFGSCNWSDITITLSGNISGVTDTDLEMFTVSANDISDNCTVDDSLDTYSCTVTYPTRGSWSGDVTLDVGGTDNLCTPLKHSVATDASVDNLDFTCGAATTLAITGSLAIDVATGSSVTATDDATEQVTACTVDSELKTYACSISVAEDQTWSGTIDMVQAGYSCTPTQHAISTSTDSSGNDFTCEILSKSVMIGGTIYIADAQYLKRLSKPDQCTVENVDLNTEYYACVVDGGSSGKWSGTLEFRYEKNTAQYCTATYTGNNVSGFVEANLNCL
ncbi:type IV pilus modification PilV family protein [Thiohalomonas denitrificans]|uniref:type IV pilus modification PilV family protein n=1 Tax=Thiohalomonas denitrificans TaxID=415747 RepID=UPI0026EAE415|nr:prepilin-type N-terminal cleavage/methylation domain-containing protein [Thiohalomonas denitrificans]